MALTYQLEKEIVGSEHLNLTPTVQRGNVLAANPDGFFLSVDKVTPNNESHKEIKKDVPNDGHSQNEEDSESLFNDEFQKKLESLDLNAEDSEVDILVPINKEGDVHSDYESEEEDTEGKFARVSIYI